MAVMLFIHNIIENIGGTGHKGKGTKSSKREVSVKGTYQRTSKKRGEEQHQVLEPLSDSDELTYGYNMHGNVLRCQSLNGG